MKKLYKNLSFGVDIKLSTLMCKITTRNNKNWQDRSMAFNNPRAIHSCVKLPQEIRKMIG